MPSSVRGVADQSTASFLARFITASQEGKEDIALDPSWREIFARIKHITPYLWPSKSFGLQLLAVRKPRSRSCDPRLNPLDPMHCFAARVLVPVPADYGRGPRRHIPRPARLLPAGAYLRGRLQAVAMAVSWRVRRTSILAGHRWPRRSARRKCGNSFTNAGRGAQCLNAFLSQTLWIPVMQYSDRGTRSHIHITVK